MYPYILIELPTLPFNINKVQTKKFLTTKVASSLCSGKLPGNILSFRSRAKHEIVFNAFLSRIISFLIGVSVNLNHHFRFICISGKLNHYFHHPVLDSIVTVNNGYGQYNDDLLLFDLIVYCKCFFFCF